MPRILNSSRFSWRRLLFLSSAFFLFLFLVFSLAPITSPLPPYRGTHDVGILDLETEVEKKRVVYNAHLKETGQNAFELSTIAVTLYYPSSPLPPGSPQPLARPWLPQPLSLIGTGYARLIGIYFPPLQAVLTFGLWALGSSTVIPGVVDAPILATPPQILVDQTGDTSTSPTTNDEKDTSEKEHLLELRDIMTGLNMLPCVVFTHGMAGMSQSYSHYLGSIASHGVLVAAIEHRDGSGPGSIIHHVNGTEEFVWHLKPDDLFEFSAGEMDIEDLKVAQLAFREAEIQETIRLFGRLNAGEGSQIVNLKPESPETALPGFEGRLNMSAITVAGHSYGATGVLQALKSAKSDEYPINGGIALDPGKESGPLNEEFDVPLLVIQSGEWTEKQADFYGQGMHFSVVKKIVEKARNSWFMTLGGTAHPSVTDAPLIVPWIMKAVLGTTLDPKVALREYIDVSVEFLEFLRNAGKVERGVLASGVTSPEGPLGEEKVRGTVERGDGAEWEVFVVPEV